MGDHVLGLGLALVLGPRGGSGVVESLGQALAVHVYFLGLWRLGLPLLCEEHDVLELASGLGVHVEQSMFVSSGVPML